ncbi:MAG: CUB domain-containing protein, partial [Bacteroidota bacterium]
MKHIQLTFLFLSLYITAAIAQAPSNDECNNAIDLGIAPICQPEVAYTNIMATTSSATNPTCFEGTESNRDVWFSFTTNPDIREYTITVKGLANGPNEQRVGNPQITLYRGNCNSLSELSCMSSENGSDEVKLDVFNVPGNRTFFIRINDFTASTIPNSGDFSVCIEEFVPAIVMGEVSSSNACSGTILDSGGEEGNYGNGENTTFTICPQSPNSCIIFDVVSYDIELNFDVLSFYAGEDNTAPLLARVSGSNFGTPFPIQASSECVTLEFISDASTTRSGFEINWNCSNNCQPTSLDRATEINNLPFSGSFSSCDVPATFAETACGTDVFLNGPEKIFTFNSRGGICASINISNAEENTGVVVLDAPPSDPNANCIAESETGIIQSADFNTPGTYYIIVAQPVNCASFDINVEEADCILSPALLNALCNPLNGCLIDGGAPSEFTFQDGFQDVTLTEQNNSGCWQNEGIEADFFWFTIEAQATGKFGFILESADAPSDIDFNVWGPFSKEDACNNKDAIVAVIEDEQPIRSSWAPNAGPTGLADIHPIFRNRVRDNYDCLTPFLPSPFGDDFVKTIDVQEGEVYVVLVNDFGNDIQGNSILVDWSPSDPEVIDRLSIEVETENVEICVGESAQLKISDGIDNISWSPSESLSCNNCLDPIATPEETTLYKAVVEGVCTMDTLEILVEVLGIDPLEDITICSGEAFELDLGTDFENATYEWIAPPQVDLSCTDCPNPIITSSTAGNYTITVNLESQDCPTTQEFTLTVLSQPAPQFDIIDDRQICEDQIPISLGSNSNPNNIQYTWTSRPEGFTSSSNNPSVSPTETTTYFVEASNGICPITAMDSVTIEVFEAPQFE